MSGYRDVIFNENKFFDSYEEKDLIKEAERSEFVKFRISVPRPTVELADDDENWLDLPFRSRLGQIPQGPPGGVTEDPRDEEDDQPLTPKQPITPIQLETPDDTPFMTSREDDVPYRFRLTGDGRTSRFASGPGENSDAANNQNVAQRKKRAKPNITSKNITFEKLPETGQTPLGVTGFRSKRVGPSAEVEESNIIEEKRTRIPNRRYATMTLTADEEQKFPAFHMAFMAGTRITNQPKHSDDLPDPPSNWRTMLSHSHATQFQEAAGVEYRALEGKKTWEIVDKAPNQHAIPLKWVFTYKCDADGYLIKHKARLVVRDDLQKLDDQDVYAATLAFKVFRTLVALMAAFKLETRQLDAVNAFLNAHNDEAVYCYLPDGYKQPKKVMKVLKALYGQRKSPLLWLRTLCMKCMELGLYQIPGEPCLFTNRNGILSLLLC